MCLIAWNMVFTSKSVCKTRCVLQGKVGSEVISVEPIGMLQESLNGCLPGFFEAIHRKKARSRRRHRLKESPHQISSSAVSTRLSPKTLLLPSPGTPGEKGWDEGS